MPTTAEIRARHQARLDMRLAETRRNNSTLWSGYVEPVYCMPSDAEIEAQARAETASLEAFKRSTRGRFLRALKDIEVGGGYPAEVYAARAAYGRGIADDRKAPDATEIGHAIKALADIPHQEARDAVAALAELLVGEVRKAA